MNMPICDIPRFLFENQWEDAMHFSDIVSLIGTVLSGLISAGLLWHLLRLNGQPDKRPPVFLATVVSKIVAADNERNRRRVENRLTWIAIIGMVLGVICQAVGLVLSRLAPTSVF